MTVFGFVYAQLDVQQCQVVITSQKIMALKRGFKLKGPKLKKTYLQICRQLIYNGSTTPEMWVFSKMF